MSFIHSFKNMEPVLYQDLMYCSKQNKHGSCPKKFIPTKENKETK